MAPQILSCNLLPVRKLLPFPPMALHVLVTAAWFQTLAYHIHIWQMGDKHREIPASWIRLNTCVYLFI